MNVKTENPHKKKRLPEYPQPDRFYAWNNGYNARGEDDIEAVVLAMAEIRLTVAHITKDQVKAMTEAIIERIKPLDETEMVAPKWRQPHV